MAEWKRATLRYEVKRAREWTWYASDDSSLQQQTGATYIRLTAFRISDITENRVLVVLCSHRLKDDPQPEQGQC